MTSHFGRRTLGATLRSATLALPLLSLAFAMGCPEEEPVVRNATLKIESEDVSLFIGDNAVVTVTSKDKAGDGSTEAVVVEVLKAEDDEALAGGIGIDEDSLAAEPLSLTPNDDGVATFVVGCSGVGTLTLTATTEAVSQPKSVEVRCKAPEINIGLTVQPFQNCRFLQADNESSCEFIVNVTETRDGVVTAAENFPVVARVTAITDIVTPDAAISTTGDRTVLATAADAPSADTVTITTGSGAAAGQVSFFVRSPRKFLEQTIAIDVTAGVTVVQTSAVIQPFTDQSALALALERSTITVGQAASLLITAVRANGTPADAGQVTLTLPAGITATQAAGVVDGNTVTLDAEGKRTVELATSEIGTFRIEGSFLAISDTPPKVATVDLTTTPQGQVNANAILDRTLIVAEANRDPKIANLTLEAVRDGVPFNNVTATVRVSLASRATLKLQAPSAGGTLVGEDEVTFSSFTDGEGTIQIVADSIDAKGSGVIEVEILDGAAILVSETLQITVDREPRLQSIVFDGVEPANGVIGVQGGVISSTAVVTFRLFDDEVRAISGAAVRYEFDSSDPGVVVDGDAASGTDGTVSVFVNAGRVAAPITVTAIATFQGVTAEATSPAIGVVGGLPNSETSSVVCSARAQFDPFTADCVATLADRFTNLADNATTVQFRAEGGNITPAVGATGGTASAAFAFGDPGPGSADVLNWSYSGVRNLPTAQRLRFAACFDADTATVCDVIAICTDADPVVRSLCPLPPTLDGTANCTSDISSVTQNIFDLQDQDEASFEIEALAGIDTVAGRNVAAEVAQYQAEHRTCGFPISCLQGVRGGLTFDPSDDCPVNLGCMDFTTLTECPQNGLLDILASVSGEEGFVDVNGNGQFDNGAEDFVDFPEPFLDKNSSCSYDELSGHPRLTPAQQVRFSDLFIDDDASDGQFGFLEGAVRTETNGDYDLNTEIFVKTSILHMVGNRIFSFGQRATGIADNDCANGSDGTNVNVGQIATGEYLRQCAPNGEIRDGDVGSFVFRWSDVNGNCVSVDFQDAPTVTGEGPLQVFADERVYDEADCGVNPGAIDAKNAARPWCEEHPAMGSPLRNVDFLVECAGAEGAQLASLTFALADEDEVEIGFVVQCPICGDGLIEGEEACEPAVAGSIPSGFTCSETCELEPEA
jgi:hypothetical protein